MDRSFFRARSALTASLIVVPALSLVGACSSSTKSANTNPDGSTNFGDGGLPVVDAGHDVGVSSVDASDATADVAVDAPKPNEEAGTSCKSNAECESGVCAPSGDAGAFDAGLCASGGCTCQPTCHDGVKDGNETDVDCGGSCSPCGTAKACVTTTDCVSATCTSNKCACSTTMTLASTSIGVPYCIDSHEVTYTEYASFTALSIPTSQQPSFCSWNTSFAAPNPPPSTFFSSPIANVNWCDAFMYCKAFGKHLCGSIADATHGINEGDPVTGGTSTADGGTADAGASGFNNPLIDEWYNACSNQGVDAYPYGSTYNGSTCNGSDSKVATCASQSCNNPANPLSVVAVGGAVQCSVGDAGTCTPTYSEATCTGGVSTTLLDMSGNVAEWENACNGTTGASDVCNVRGGSFADGQSALTCANTSQPAVPRSTANANIGFRCCL